MITAVFQQPNASYHATSARVRLAAGPLGVARDRFVAAGQPDAAPAPGTPSAGVAPSGQ